MASVMVAPRATTAPASCFLESDMGFFFCAGFTLTALGYDTSTHTLALPRDKRHNFYNNLGDGGAFFSPGSCAVGIVPRGYAAESCGIVAG